MSYKVFRAVFSSIVLFALAVATVWANDKIAYASSFPSAQPAPVTQPNAAGSCEIWRAATRGVSSRLAGSFDTILLRNNALATQGAKMASAENSFLSQNHAAAAAQNGASVSPAAGQASGLLPNESSTHVTVDERGKWKTGSVITWSIADGPGPAESPFSGYMGSQYEALIQEAFQAWAAASGLSFQEVRDSSQSDIRLGWDDFNISSTGVVGYTTSRAQSGELLPGVIIRLEDPKQDSLVAGAGSTLTYSGTTANFSQVIRHEIGHALGLADNDDPNSIMNFEATGANNALSSSDVARIQTLYGSPTLAGQTLQTAAAELSGKPMNSLTQNPRQAPASLFSR